VSAQEREWQPGDKALIEVEVSHESKPGRPVWIRSPFGGTRGVATNRLRPVSCGGEVEAATDDAIDRAARTVVKLSTFDFEQARYLVGLLVGGVPGRSEAEIKAEALREAADAYEADEARHPVRRAAFAAWLCARAARVAGTTEAGDERPLTLQPGEDEMCPNCLTPWKCNGPHEPADTEGSNRP